MTLEHDHDAHDHEGHDHDAHERDEHDDEEGHDHSGHEHVDYPTAVTMYRADKDEYFRTGHDSPVPAAERGAFTGLPYFPIDEALRFEGVALEPYAGSEPANFEIPTSDGKLRAAVRAGTFEFQLGAATQRLTALHVRRGRFGVGLRAVPRWDQRIGDVWRGPLSRPLPGGPTTPTSSTSTSRTTHRASTTLGSPARSRPLRTGSRSGSRQVSA